MSSRRLVPGLIGLSMIIIVSGCSSTKNVTVRSYIQDKKRVDQESSGNAGYLMGSSKEAPADTKDTRKIYVLEFTKEAPELMEEDVSVQTTTTSPSVNLPQSDSGSRSQVQADSAVPVFDPSQFETDDPSAETTGSFIEYKVEKDDTLQKISKKFYNSYGKWSKIYEANKAKIKNPDRIQPGIVIRIPQ